MTDEEKAEKHTKENYCNKCYLQNCSRRKNVSCYAMHYNDFLDGLAEGRKEGYEQGKKDYITNDRSYVIPTKEMSYVEIAKENAELKAQIEKMKICASSWIMSLEDVRSSKVNDRRGEVLRELEKRVENKK